MTNSTFTSHSCVEPISTSSRRITLPPTLPMSSAPARHMPMTGLMEYALTTGISSTGMAACVTSAVSTFRRIARRALFINLFAQTASDYPQPRQRQPHPHFLQAQRQSHSLDGRFRSMRHCNTSRGFGAGVLHLVRCIRSPYHTLLTSIHKSVSLSPGRPSNTKARTFPFSLLVSRVR